VKEIGSDIVPFPTDAAARSAAAIITFRSAFVMAGRPTEATALSWQEGLQKRRPFLARTQYCTSNLSC